MPQFSHLQNMDKMGLFMRVDFPSEGSLGEGPSQAQFSQGNTTTKCSLVVLFPLAYAYKGFLCRYRLLLILHSTSV